MRMAMSNRLLPVLDGVSASRVALPSGPWLTVLDFLCERFPHVDRLQWQERMVQNKVLNSMALLFTHTRHIKRIKPFFITATW